jgi:hypothetical protein
MFGLNDSTNQASTDTMVASASGSSALPPLQTSVPAAGTDTSPPLSDAPPASMQQEDTSSAQPPAPLETPAAPDSSSQPANPGGGINDVNLENAYITTDPQQTSQASSAGDTPDTSQPTVASLMNNSNDDELIKIKQQALQSLAPLVDHLEQNPQEKFKTTMMMIQASDNADLIPEAYEAANKISDEKARAQALLDVVNEINYFTQQHNK